jgi:hypothetical protein
MRYCFNLSRHKITERVKNINKNQANNSKEELSIRREYNTKRIYYMDIIPHIVKRERNK